MIAQIYGPRYSTLSVITGRRQDWDDVLLVMEIAMKIHCGIQCVAYFPNGEQIASGSDNGDVHIWDAYNGKAVAGANLKHPRGVRALSVLPAGNRIMTMCNDGILRVWDVISRRCIFEAEVQMDFDKPIGFSPDGAYCAFVSNHGAIQIREVKEGGELRNCVRPPTVTVSDIRSLVFSQDGSLLISGSNTIITWNTRNGEIHGESMTSKFVASASDYYDGTIQLWDL